jgi:hypothetical protein
MEAKTMGLILMDSAEIRSRWRLYIVSPALRRWVLIVGGIGTACVVFGGFLSPRAPGVPLALLSVAISWAAAMFVPVWNRQIVKPMFDRFLPGDEGSRRGFYGFFELFSLCVLPWQLVGALLQLFRSTT